MKEISGGNYSVYMGETALQALQKLLTSKSFREAQKLLLVDENSLEYCFPKLITLVPALEKAELLEIESGEESKTIEVTLQIWEALSEMEIRRDAVLINLGGGMIGDLGGFAAATFKRGIRFIQVPTTLLAMVDASVGGKVGIDLNRLKNQIGVFQEPQGVYIDVDFLRTLPKNQILSGFAEIIKHALIADAEYWEEVKKATLHELHENIPLISRSIEIKNAIVIQDPKETGVRKLLNFGHTIGHAIETYSFENAGRALLHGEAIAIGMICESYLSNKLGNLSKKELDEIVAFIAPLYPHYTIEEVAGHRLIELMRNDKKNTGPQINFTLLNSIGSAVHNQKADAADILEALAFYRNK